MHDLPIMKQLSCLSALEVIVKHVGSFLSPYVMEILEHSLNSQLLSGAPPQECVIIIPKIIYILGS